MTATEIPAKSHYTGKDCHQPNSKKPCIQTELAETNQHSSQILATHYRANNIYPILRLQMVA
jgi:hypothetical protein